MLRSLNGIGVSVVGIEDIKLLASLMTDEEKQSLYEAEELRKAKDAEDRARIKAEKENEDWRVVLSTANGRRVIWKLLGDLGYGTSTNSTATFTDSEA